MTSKIVRELENIALEIANFCKEIGLIDLIKEQLGMMNAEQRSELFDVVCNQKSDDHQFIDDTIEYTLTLLPEHLMQSPLIEAELSENIVTSLIVLQA